jgi:hypothetical protein
MVHNNDGGGPFDIMFSVPYHVSRFSAKACPPGRDWPPGNERIAEIKKRPVHGAFSFVGLK